jgi:hypothetical protein
VQALGGRGGLAIENNFVAHGLHAEHSDIVLNQHGEHFLFEALIVRIHYVERHLNSIECELVGEGRFQHFEVNVWTLVSSETDVANLSLLLCSQRRFHAASLAKDASGIALANHFMELQQVDVVGLQAT